MTKKSGIGKKMNFDKLFSFDGGEIVDHNGLPFDKSSGIVGDDMYRGSELKLIETLESIIKTGNRIPPDLRIDDRDLKEFPNFYTFCFSKNGLDQAPFARQLELATKLLAEYCPRCTKKRSDPKDKKAKKFLFAENMSLPLKMDSKSAIDHIQFLEYGVCPRCKATKSELYKNKELRVYNEFDGCIGQRAGKSAFLSLLVPYIVHKYLKLQKPVEAFGLLKNSILVGTFVGLTFAKAVELLWTPLHNIMSTCPWYKEYHGLLDFYGEKYGEEEIYKFKDTFIAYPHRSLYLHPSGPNKRTLRGATRFISCVDELGWFSHGEEEDSKERTSANEVYVSLDNSLTTVRKAAQRLLRAGNNNIPMAYSMNISSPSSFQDKIMTLVRQYEGSKRVLTFHGATWEFNPNLRKKDFADKYRTDPIKAERDFGANPPMSEHPYIEDISYIERSAKQTFKNRVSYVYKTCRSKSGAIQRYGELKSVDYGGQIPRHVLAIDAGFSNNSFSMSLGYVEKLKEKLYPTLTAMIEIAPKKNESTLNYSKIASALIYPLIKQMNVGLVLADRWNSLKLLHDIEAEMKIHTLQYSMRPDDFSYVHDNFVDENEIIIKIPIPEIPLKSIMELEMDNYPHCFGPTNKVNGISMPVAHFIHQCMTVSENSKGVPDKGAGYTDDLFRSAFLALSFLLDDDAVKEYELLGRLKDGKRVAVGYIGDARSQMSGGGSGTKTTGIGSVGGSRSSIGAGSGGAKNTFIRSR